MISQMAGVEIYPIKPGSSGKPVTGFQFEIVDDDGNILPRDEEGSLVIKYPLPPGCLPNLWNDIERFKESYLETVPGYYFSGDGAYIDKDGYIFIIGRIDDVINVAGHRLSTSDMEEIVAYHNSVAECAVIGVNNDLKGQIPLGLVVVKEGIGIDAQQLENELIDMVRNRLEAVAAFKTSLVVKRLPKTRSGKILRKSLRAIANGEAVALPSTIEEPLVLKEIEEVFSLRNNQTNTNE